MMEFLVKRADGVRFDSHSMSYAEVLRPRSFPSRPSRPRDRGDFCLVVRGCRIVFCYKDPGWHLYFENDALTHAEAEQVVREITESISKATGQACQVFPK
jgi:hypothetical protein